MQGKTNKSYEASAKILIGCVLGIFFLIVFLLISSETKGQDTGYRVVIDPFTPTRKVEVKETPDTAVVNALFEKHFKLDGFSITAAMGNTRMFDAENEKVWVYCEKRRIKVKKNGKVKYKRIR